MKKTREQRNAESKETVDKVVAWYKADKGKKFYKRRWFLTLGAVIIAKNIFFGGTDAKVPPVTKVAVVQPVVKAVVLTPAQIAVNKQKAVAKAKADAVAKTKAVAKAKADAITAKRLADIADYKLWVDSQFSPWDGSHMDLVKLIKEHLNDPKSFEHVKTTYIDKGYGLEIHMTYRAKNAYGGLILQNVTAIADKAKNEIRTISSND